MKTYGRVDVYVHVILTSALVGGERSTSCPSRFSPEERTHCIGNWVGPKTDLDDAERKILGPTGTRTPTPLSSSP
jgi:hypothetical protein